MHSSCKGPNKVDAASRAVCTRYPTDRHRQGPRPADPLLAAFRSAAAEVPAYGQILAEAGVNPDGVLSPADFFRRVPVIDKSQTFTRFPIQQLCRGGEVGDVCGLLTSSGHSGRFSFSIYSGADAAVESDEVDAALDRLFGVRDRKTLLINALPMGVGVPTRLCAVGQTSVRADMVVAQAQTFGPHFEQIILVGDALFLKHALELGRSKGLDWSRFRVHCVVGEEPLAENARTYLAGLLGHDPDRPETGLIVSSMGAAELGLNLFFELPELILLRRRLHADRQLRQAVVPDAGAVLPMVFTYDPKRVCVEVLDGERLVVSTLDRRRRIPLIRYATGDSAGLLDAKLPELGLPAGEGGSLLPLILIYGRAGGLKTPSGVVYPEQVKEGLYDRPELAEKTTANFRLSLRDGRAHVRIQLVPGVRAGTGLRERFIEALSEYVPLPFSAEVAAYEGFGSGMALDYERKFDYLGP